MSAVAAPKSPRRQVRTGGTTARTSSSAAAKTTAKRDGSKKDSSKPKLRVVDKAAMRRRARQRTLLTMAAGLVTTALFGVALLYGQLVEGQQETDTMRAEIAQAEAERARLERDVAIASTPAEIVRRATALGMVRAQNPQYLIAVRAIEAGQ